MSPENVLSQAYYYNTLISDTYAISAINSEFILVFSESGLKFKGKCQCLIKASQSYSAVELYV